MVFVSCVLSFSLRFPIYLLLTYKMTILNPYSFGINFVAMSQTSQTYCRNCLWETREEAERPVVMIMIVKLSSNVTAS